jgi:glycosyltransferase AglD
MALDIALQRNGGNHPRGGRYRCVASRRRSSVVVADTPMLSVVVPVYNEEAILERAVRRFIDELKGLDRSFELLLCANGCTDQTVAIGTELAESFAEVAIVVSPAPDYGRALRLGIEAAAGRFVLCDEIDLCDIDFHRRALRRLEDDSCDFVVGSKAMPGARDKRPMTRRAATQVINGMLRLSVGFQGTDTHGLKAFVRDKTLPVVRRCVVSKDLFASELVIRAGRSGLRVVEIPIELEEQRRTPIHLFKRVPRVMADMAKLIVAIHRYGDDPGIDGTGTSGADTVKSRSQV